MVRYSFGWYGNIDNFIVLLQLLFIVQWVNADKYTCAPVIMTMTIDTITISTTTTNTKCACLCESVFGLFVLNVDYCLKCVSVYRYKCLCIPHQWWWWWWWSNKWEKPTQFWRQQFNWSDLEPLRFRANCYVSFSSHEQTNSAYNSMMANKFFWNFNFVWLEFAISHECRIISCSCVVC